MAATGPIATFGAITAGMTYANGTYLNVPLTGGSGSGATANITVAGTVVTVVAMANPTASAVLDRTGKNYQVGDSLSAAAGFDGVGAGSGFAVAVATLAAACENCFFGKVVPSSGGALFGQRYCSNNAFDNGVAPPHVYDPMITRDDFFCGDGADLPTGKSFSSIVTQQPGSQQYSSAPWNSFTPVVVPQAGAITTVTPTCRYSILGKTIVFVMDIIITTNGTGSGAVLATLPVTPKGAGGITASFAGYRSSDFKALSSIISGPEAVITLYDGTYPGADGVSLFISGVYEAA